MLIILLLASIAGLVRPCKGDSGCAARWGFWLTPSNGTFEHGLAECGEMGLAMIPIMTVDPVNPVLRYMAARVAEECKVDTFWIDTGLYSAGLIVKDVSQGEFRALCYEPSIPQPSNAQPAQSVYVTITEPTTHTVTRLFDIGIVVTETEVVEPSTTIYTSTTVTETEWTTQTFSIPTNVRYANLFWSTVVESEVRTGTLAIGTSHVTRTISLTVTTSVIAVTNRVSITTTTIRRSTTPPKQTPLPYQPPSVVQGVKRLTCGKYSSLAALKVCDSAEQSSGLVMIVTPNDFSTAGCICAEMGLKLADLADSGRMAAAKQMLRQCTDLPDQAAWVGRLDALEGTQVCMAVGRISDGPVACVQELSVFCQE